jgi:hypothetical protein
MIYGQIFLFLDHCVTGHKRNVVREEFGVTDIGTVIKILSKQLPEDLEEIPEKRIPKLRYQHDPRGRGSSGIRQKDGRSSFTVT